MARIKFLAWVLSVIMLCCCTANEMVTAPEENRNMTVDKCYQKALSDAFDLMKTIYPEKHDRLIASKHLLRPEYYTTATLAEARPDLQQVRYTKSTNGSSALDTLLYIVNFGNDEGFAVMYADTTVPNNVIAITESGSLTIDDLMRDYNNMPAGVYAVTPGGTMAGLVGNAVTNLTENQEWRTGKGEINTSGLPYNEASKWENTGNYVKPLVKIKIGQRKPFNELCPIRGKDKDNAPAGCVAIALINIMSAKKYPTTINGYTGDWDYILANTTTSECPLILKRWIYEVGRICNMNYGADGSGSTDYQAKQCLNKFPRFQDLDITKTLNVDKISAMLQKGNPLYCSGYDQKANSGHAWVLDGFLEQYQITYLVDPVKNTRKETNRKYRKLIHCNFGWRGHCDGYYALDCFDLKKGAIRHDDGDYGQRELNFSYNTKVITYTFK